MKPKAKPIDRKTPDNSSFLKFTRNAGFLSILESVIIGVLGVILIANPDWILQIIFYVVGIILIVKGVYKIVNYFIIRGRYDFYNNDLLYGILALIFGILAVVLWEQLSNAIGLVVGAWMVYGALVRINTAIKLHSAKVKAWSYVLALSLVMLAFGVYLIISMGSGMTQIVGWIMVIAAFIGIADDVIFMHNIDAITK